MELNGDIIRQLYGEITFGKRTATLVGRTNDDVMSHTRFSKVPCLKAFYRFFDAINAAFPDYRLLLENILVKGNRVMVRYTISGTHKGEFMGLTATNQQVAITGIHVFRVYGGQIVEYWDGAPQITASSKETPKRTSTLSSSKLASTTAERKPLSLSV